MASKTPKRTSRTAILRVGDRVRFHYGDHDVVAIIVEDRGNIGRGGRQLPRVRADLGRGEEDEFEVAAEDVRAA